MKYFVKQFAGKAVRAALLLIGISFLSFFLVSVSPIDPLQSNVGQAALGSLSQDQVARLETYWQVDVPILERYLHWACGVIQGDFGVSLLYRRPVIAVLGERLANSIGMLACAWLLSGVLGITLGVIAGANEGRLVDKTVQRGCLVLASLPSFWIGLIFLMIFAVWLKILPIGFSVPAGMEAAQVSIGDQLRHAILPALTLSVSGASAVALHTREKMIEIMRSDYILFAKARGESTVRRVVRHALRNLLLPVVTLQFACVSEIVGGSLLAEQVFSYPGLGQTAVAAGLGGDMPLLLGITMVCAIFVFAGNVAADLLYGVIDPKMRRRRDHR